MIHHDVDDTANWLASPKREEFFGSLGVTNIRTFTNPQNPNQVALTLEVPDLDARTAALQSPEAAEAMQHSGVHPDSVVLLVESKLARPRGWFRAPPSARRLRAPQRGS